MTPEDDRFLALVRADPDDDGPRLVYADWLQQRALESLDLRATGISDAGLVALARAPFFRRLRRLNVGDTPARRRSRGLPS